MSPEAIDTSVLPQNVNAIANDSKIPAPSATENVLPLAIEPSTNHHQGTTEEDIQEVCEAEPEKIIQPQPRERLRLQEVGRYVGRLVVTALDRALVLVVALGIMALLKFCACKCGFMLQ